MDDARCYGSLSNQDDEVVAAIITDAGRRDMSDDKDPMPVDLSSHDGGSHVHGSVSNKVSEYHDDTPRIFWAGLHEKDINKRGTAVGDVAIPESLGLVSAVVYIIVLCLLNIPGDRHGYTLVYTIAMAAARLYG